MSSGRAFQALVLALVPLLSPSTSTDYAASGSPPPTTWTTVDPDEIEPATSCNADVVDIVQKTRTAFRNLSPSRSLLDSPDRYIAGVRLGNVTLNGLDTLQEDRMYVAFCRGDNPVVTFSLIANSTLRVSANYSCGSPASIAVFAGTLHVHLEVTQTRRALNDSRIDVGSLYIVRMEDEPAALPECAHDLDRNVARRLNSIFRNVTPRRRLSRWIEDELRRDLEGSLRKLGY